MSKIKKVVMVQPASAGGNFEYMAIPRQGMLFLSAALAQWEGDYLYERSIWFEDRSGLMDPDKDLPLKGKLIIQMYEKQSSRTRLSFHIAIKQLGANNAGRYY